MQENEIETMIVDSAAHLHQDHGPERLESVYKVALASKLLKPGLRVERQVSIPIEYEGQRFDEGFRAALVVEGKVIVEHKPVGESLMKESITRNVNGEVRVLLRDSVTP